ncbi:hypothetical protein BZG36_01670 [Bifiguratus adelaidae]|uniref:phospholipase D n=1 Tax=Bifiguratus adelaidae TaxID=1938954 RepID=A0A261Y4K5_9FUNG|nr:hypothetical protein BZG36_01670 [Bifiguratus adelaidae]
MTTIGNFLEAAQLAKSQRQNSVGDAEGLNDPSSNNRSSNDDQGPSHRSSLFDRLDIKPQRGQSIRQDNDAQSSRWNDLFQRMKMAGGTDWDDTNNEVRSHIARSNAAFGAMMNEPEANPRQYEGMNKDAGQNFFPRRMIRKRRSSLHPRMFDEQNDNYMPTPEEVQAREQSNLSVNDLSLFQTSQSTQTRTPDVPPIPSVSPRRDGRHLPRANSDPEAGRQHLGFEQQHLNNFLHEPDPEVGGDASPIHLTAIPRYIYLNSKHQHSTAITGSTASFYSASQHSSNVPNVKENNYVDLEPVSSNSFESTAAPQVKRSNGAMRWQRMLDPVNAPDTPSGKKSGRRASEQLRVSSVMETGSPRPQAHHSEEARASPVSTVPSLHRTEHPNLPKVTIEPPTTATTPVETSTAAHARARANWGTGIQKARALKSATAFMDSAVRQRNLQTVHSTGATGPLVPFFAPALSVPYFWIVRDEHDRRPPPVILNALNLAITDSNVDVDGLRRQWIFRIELAYGDTKWVIKRTLVDFYNLHLSLKIKARLSTRNFPDPPNFPSQLAHAYHSAMASLTAAVIGDKEDAEERADVKQQLALERRKQLEEYLITVIRQSNMRVNYDLFEFLEISAISITKDMGWKGKEGYLENKVELLATGLCHGFKLSTWSSEWVILRDSYIAFCSDIGASSPNDVFLFDKSIKIKRELSHYLNPLNHHHFSLASDFQRIDIKGSTNRVIDDWMDSLQQVMESSPWVKTHRFDSFAPEREAAKVKWYVDGEDYFHAVSEAILAAKSEIYIADWWLSPEIYMRRPPAENEEFRLDRLLQRKAQEGIMIYIAIYKEMTVALANNSNHTKNYLQSLHPNILVQRHPDHGVDGTQFWAHHEKILVVDYRLAFIGGLDLCFGRYDTHFHHLADYSPEGSGPELWSGQDYSNPRIKDFVNVAQYDMTLVDKRTTARMPWHDVHLGMVGQPARDVARHFVQRWNFIKAEKGAHRTNVPLLVPKGEYVAARDESKFKGTCRVQILRSSAIWSHGVMREHSVYNAYVECITRAEHFIYIENQFFVTACHSDPKYTVKNKIGQALVERIKRAHEEDTPFRVIVIMPLAPAFEGDLASPESATCRTVMHWQYVSICRGGNSVMELLRNAGINPEDYISFFSLRTVDKIYPNSETYKHKAAEKAAQSMNGNGQIKASTKSRENGQIPTEQSANAAGSSAMEIPAIAPSSQASKDSRMSNNKRSSAATAEAPTTGGTASTADPKASEWVTEQLYIHTKLMIVDDRIVICGSANLNDRQVPCKKAENSN